MDGLNPPLKCLIEIQSSLQNGETARAGAQRYLQRASTDDPFATTVRRFLFSWDQGQDWRRHVAELGSPHRRALIELLATAMSGQPILAHLEELRAEITSAASAEISRHLELLPLKMLIPLLLLQFPAFLILLFGPLLSKLLEEINR